MKPQLQPQSIRALPHVHDFCVVWTAFQVAFSPAEGRSHRADHTQPDPISNPTTPSHPGTGLPHLSSHLSTIQIP